MSRGQRREEGMVQGEERIRGERPHALARWRQEGAPHEEEVARASCLLLCLLAQGGRRQGRGPSGGLGQEVRQVRFFLFFSFLFYFFLAFTFRILNK